MRVWLEGSKTKTKNSRNAGTKKRIWPRRVMASSTKFQTPSSKLQRNPGVETPKTKLQTPKKSQVPSSKPRPALRAFSLELLWSLELGVWCLGPGASLELGVWNLELFAWALSLSKIEMRPIPESPRFFYCTPLAAYRSLTRFLRA